GFGEASRADYRTTYKISYGLTDADIGQVHHAVEQQLLTKWSTLNISASEIHSLENLRGLPPGQAGRDLHQLITNDWENWIRDWEAAGKVPTREDVLSMAKTIDDDFGYLFIPPIRRR